MNGISSDLQKLLRYYNSTAIVVFLKIPFASSAFQYFPSNLALYLKDLKLLTFTVSS